MNPLVPPSGSKPWDEPNIVTPNFGGVNDS